MVPGIPDDAYDACQIFDAGMLNHSNCDTYTISSHKCTYELFYDVLNVTSPDAIFFPYHQTKTKQK
jgi:hypothetical protein